ncbi:hypothetical protein [Aureispira anguillae]|uniref:Uncharacterized protein n=1 Tax=Aureispira anguillae TaxID=2864201 RepID=A0A915YJT6_9BACT|nr:hypothetical protein [Aureispira anguillae]BDS14314.1 hypothetical protein AsAng_0050930 [Aureispira anguillae]
MKTIMNYYLLIFFGLSLCWSCQSESSAPSATTSKTILTQNSKAINVSLNMTQVSYAIGSPITLRFVLKNNENKDVSFCPFNSPAHQAAWTNCFRIKDAQGNLIPFVGKTATYSDETNNKQLITIEPQGIRIYTIDIRTIYQLDQRGTYTIRFIGDAINLLSNSLPAQFSIK